MLTTCTGTLSTTKTCLKMLEHYWFLGCETRFACFQYTFLYQVEDYGKQVFFEESDILRRVEADNASEFFEENDSSCIKYNGQ